MYTIVFLGSGELACGVLQGLLASEHEIIGVLPWESLKKARVQTRLKRHFITDTQAQIEQYQLHALTPCRANSSAFAQQMAALAPDLLLVAGWGEILSPEAIALPRVACINVHPSLLPRHRGFNPVCSVLRAGETQTGVTFHYLTSAIDAGDILLQSSIPVAPQDDGDSLSRKLGFLAMQTVNAALANIGNHAAAQPQDEQLASYFRKITPRECRIDWSQPAKAIHNQIRGCFPWTPCTTRHKQQVLQILESQPIIFHQPCHTPGRVIYRTGVQLVVATGDQNEGLLIRDMSVVHRFGKLKAKLYLTRQIHVGDTLE